MDEISSLTESSVALNNVKGAANSFLPRIGSLFHGVEWSDSPFARLNVEQVKYMYQSANKAVGSDKRLQELLERSTLDTTDNNYVRNVMDMKIWDSSTRSTISKSLSEFKKAIKGTNYEKMMKLDKEYEAKLTKVDGHTERLKILRDLSKKADDFIVNDVSDIITINLLKDILAKGDISPERFTLISRKVEALKKNSYLMARSRNKLVDAIEKLDSHFDKTKEIAEFFGKEIKEVKSKDDFRTAELDQSQIDAEIKAFRATEKLNKLENQLFDQLMLGSIN